MIGATPLRPRGSHTDSEEFHKTHSDCPWPQVRGIWKQVPHAASRHAGHGAKLAFGTENTGSQSQLTAYLLSLIQKNLVFIK